MKKTVDTRALTVNKLFILFDSLILPIFTYGAQIWLPMTAIGKELAKVTQPHAISTTILKNAAKDNFELFHLQYMKWVLGLHKRASNICCYDDTGRHPTGLRLLLQSLNYFERTRSIANLEPDSLVGNAFVEQKNLELDWFTTWNNCLLSSPRPEQCRSIILGIFEEEWDCSRHGQSKLSFYNSVKTDFGLEPYLEIVDEKARKAITRLRSSAHDLRVETGRYASKHKTPTVVDRCCRYCCEVEELPHFRDFNQSLNRKPTF